MMSAGYIKTLGQSLTLIFLMPFHLAMVHAQDAISAINTNFSPGIRIPTPPVQPIKPVPNWSVRKPFNDRSDRRFILLSAAVYAAATLDMHESLSLRPTFHEDDPLAKPIARFPAPAYYATGAAFATGMNWLGWRMARSERWHSVWWLPQMCSIAGNLLGYGYTKRHEHSR
jgi:hypothetical protein